MISLLQSPTAGRWSGTWRKVQRIAEARTALRTVSDQELAQRARSLRWRMVSGAAGDQATIEGFALAAEAVHRTLGFDLYPVQFYAGLLLHGGAIAEMQTGEGKTLTAVAPASLQALRGRGSHVMTANEYLAQRDAEKMRPVYEMLGLTVGVVHSELEPDERRAAYACDVTYGTANEFGFDYLRDRLALNGRPAPEGEVTIEELADLGVVQRGQVATLIDEADSILLDEGRTPLIIALPTKAEETLAPFLKWAHQVSQTLERDRDYEFDTHARAVHLTHSGCQRLLLCPRPLEACEYDLETVYRRVETALEAQIAFQRDREYLLKDDEVQIVDESTGRSLDGRRWQNGLHQAVEIKEGLEPSDDHRIAASITLQRFIRLYEHSCGMTGTAWTARAEFRRLYRRPVQKVPTHRQSQRKGWPARIFANQASKNAAIVQAVMELRRAGRATLIGTPSIRASELLSECLTQQQVPHRLLNARQDATEAEIVSEAGHAGRVTIATNMAGRGTDIELEDDVRASGGLHVIASEMCSSQRIDRQLIGRAARQGDPGTYQFFLSLEDELLWHLPESRRRRWQNQARREGGGELSSRRWLPTFQRVQKNLELRHARDRRRLLKSEKTRWTTTRQMGLDPCLDLVEDQ